MRVTNSPNDPQFLVTQYKSIAAIIEPSARQAYYDDLRRIAADPDKHREYVMRTSMIQSLRDVAKID